MIRPKKSPGVRCAGARDTGKSGEPIYATTPLDQQLRALAKMLINSHGSPEKQIERREFVAERMVQIADQINVVSETLRDR